MAKIIDFDCILYFYLNRYFEVLFIEGYQEILRKWIVIINPYYLIFSILHEDLICLGFERGMKTVNCLDS